VVGTYVHPELGPKWVEYQSCRKEYEAKATWGRDDGGRDITAPATDLARQWDGWKGGRQALKPALEPIIICQKPGAKRIIDNLRDHGVGAFNCRGAAVPFEGGDGYEYPRGPGGNTWSVGQPPDGTRTKPVCSAAGRHPANLLVSDGALNGRSKFFSLDAWADEHLPAVLDVPKPSRAEKEAGLDGIESIVVEWGFGEDGAQWDSEDRQVRLLVDTEQSRPRVIAAYGTKSASAIEWNMFLFGSEPTALFQKATAFTTRTGSHSTTDSKTLSWLRTCTTNVSTVVVNCETASGGNHVPSAGQCDTSLSITLAPMVSVPGVNHAASPMRLRISASDVPGHPTTKPVALMGWLAKLLCPPGGTVLDPFLGSGTTLVAAAKLGLNGIGIEREAEYVTIARARVAKATEQLRLEVSA